MPTRKRAGDAGREGAEVGVGVSKVMIDRSSVLPFSLCDKTKTVGSKLENITAD